MNRLLLLLTFFLVAVLQVAAQKSFWNSPDAFLGQQPPNDTPKIFAPGKIEGDGIAMDRVAFSSDGKEFYYVYAKQWFNTETAKIKYFRFLKGKWTGPFVMNEHLYGPTFSIDEKTMFFLGKSGEVWRSSRTEGTWSKPGLYLKKTYGLYDFTPVKNGAVYIASNGRGKGNIKDWNTYDFSTLHIRGRDTVVTSLGVPLNTTGFDGDFYIAPDESFMVISTKESKDFECELYVSFKTLQHTWTNPKSLGPLINNGIAHRWGEYVTPDRKFLFYTRATSEADCHLYWVRFDYLLDSLRHSNFTPYAKSTQSNLRISKKKMFKFDPGKLFIDDDGNQTLKYSVKPSPGQSPAHSMSYNPGEKMLISSFSQKGNYVFIITATDPKGEQAQHTLNLEVTD
jgi:hypothetical protein